MGFIPFPKPHTQELFHCDGFTFIHSFITVFDNSIHKTNHFNHLLVDTICKVGSINPTLILEVCKNVADLGRWGNGDVEVGFNDSQDLEYIMFLIQQSFDNHSEDIS